MYYILTNNVFLRKIVMITKTKINEKNGILFLHTSLKSSLIDDSWILISASAFW